MLYRVKYLQADGYVVYRHCFAGEASEKAVSIHKTAVFVTEIEAEHYAAWRNLLTIQNGSDAIGPQ